MNDPTYTYVKGKGWVPDYDGSYSFEYRGQTVLLEHRYPDPGEYYEWVYDDEATWVKDKKPVWEVFAGYVKKYPKERKWFGGQHVKNAVYVTVTYL